VKPSPPPPLVEFHDCRKLAPCHVPDDDTDLRCATFYAKRFWDRAPAALREKLQFQRDNRPPNCWYETELLTFHKTETADTKLPYPKAVCNGPFPENIVYWHNFKVAGTTARHALGVWGFPGYESGHHIFSDQLRELFPELTFDDFEVYLKHVDTIKQQAYERQLSVTNDGNRNYGFTFVRSPVQRFLSGMEQVERLNDHDWEVSPESRRCMDIPHAATKVECVVDRIIDTGIFFNVHVYPQAYLFDTWTKRGEFDLAITVLDLKDMDPLFKRFKGRLIQRVRESSVEGTKLNLKDKDLEPRLLVKICKLYEADLLMLKTLGMEDPLCKKALSRH
jgi:hypothetical protein